MALTDVELRVLEERLRIDVLFASGVGSKPSYRQALEESLEDRSRLLAEVRELIGVVTALRAELRTAKALLDDYEQCAVDRMLDEDPMLKAAQQDAVNELRMMLKRSGGV